MCCDEGCLPDSGNRAQETCYSDDNDNDPESKFCANVEDGGCPCPEEEKKCIGEFDAYGCLPKSNCCDYETQETCASPISPISPSADSS